MLIQSNHTCEVAGDLAVREFTIAASPKMFKILSDQLYSDKELAIVRELVSNAWDAHVAGNNTVTPMHVHLPTVVEPWFEVKDFGTGLSHDDIHELYTTYGASNKTNSNDLIGGFGLGSKSPLAYTDQFTVESRFKNERRTYQVFIQQSGAPAVTLLDTEFYVGPAGMTINVPVGADAAFTNFEMALAKLMPYIATTPKVNKSEDWVNQVLYDTQQVTLKIASDEIHPLVKGYSIMRDATRKMTFVQGITPYRDSSELWIYMRERMDRNDYELLNRLHLTVDVQIGALEVTASREALSWSELTKSNSTTILEAIVKHARKELTKQVESATDWFTWQQSLQSLGVSHNHNGLDIEIDKAKVMQLPFAKYLHNYEDVTDAWRFNNDVFGADFVTRGYINFRNWHVARLKNPKLSEAKYMSAHDDHMSMSLFLRSIVESTGQYDINKAAILVSESLNRPWRKHVRQLFDNKVYDYMIVAQGTLSVVRDAVAELGIPLDVIELKSIKTARSASTAGSRANAAINELSDSVKAFYGSRMYKYVDDGVTKYSSNHLYQQTLKQHVDWAEANNAAIVIISTGDNRSVEEQKFQRFIEDYAPDGLRAGYFTMPWDGVMVLQINESFSRLRNMVADAYEETVTIEDFMDAIERNEDAMLDGYLNLMAVGERRLINFAISEDFDAFQSIQLYDMRRNMLKLFEQASSKFIIGLTRLSPQDTKYLKQIQQAIKDIKLIADEYSSTTGTEQQCLEYLGASAEMNELVAQVYARWESLRTERIPMLFKSMEFASPRLFRLWRAAFTPALDITKASYHHRIETLSSIDDLIHIYNGAMHS